MIGMVGASILTPNISSSNTTQKRHFITLSFDDGFKKSSIKTAEIFEKYNLRACFNIVAGRSGAKDIIFPDKWHKHPAGSWDLWNELINRGHEVMPHGLIHANLAELPLQSAQNIILTNLNIFEEKLRGFEPSKSVFNFPYNRSTPELELWLKAKVMAIRCGGPAINPIPFKNQFRLTCTTGNKSNIDNHLNREINKLLNQKEGWLIYNTHGLDDEGWGPLSSKALNELLSRLKDISTVTIVNPAKILSQINHK